MNTALLVATRLDPYISIGEDTDILSIYSVGKRAPFDDPQEERKIPQINYMFTLTWDLVIFPE